MPTLETGQIFERYRIIQWLGSGVSGESYEAEDTTLLRRVTLKLIHPRSALPDSIRRQFFREMQGISILSHPYLASVLDYGEIDGKLYVARRFISNGSLLNSNGRLWFRTPLDVSNAIHYGHQLAQALQFSHNRGYLHGALTFSNILVSRGPNLKNQTDYAPFLLADVGLTNFIRRFAEHEDTPLPITSAPEQLDKRVIPASDQFALAVVLYFWLTGHPPFVGSPEEIEHLKLTQTTTPPSSFNPRITAEQDAMVLRALSVYPEDRYLSVRAFTNALLSTLPPQPKSSLRTELETRMVLENQPASEPEAPLQSELSPVEQLAGAEVHPSDSLMQDEHVAVSARLIIISPYTGEPYEAELQDDETTIGRAGSSDILLDRDDLTSRHHALLKRENGRYVIYDRRSANGVQVNGQQLKGDSGFALIDGDHISIGNYELIFRLGMPEVTGEERSLTLNSTAP